MIKVNFRQPKYIFPAVIFIPLCALVYFVMQTFGGGSTENEETVAIDRINMELPEANAGEAGDKMYEMSRRFGDEDAFTAVSGIGEEEADTERIGHGYTEEELDRIDAAEAERNHQSRNWRSWNAPLRSRGATSIPMPTGTERPDVAHPRRRSSPATWRRYSGAATSGRRPSSKGWGSEALKRKKRRNGSGPTP